MLFLVMMLIFYELARTVGRSLVASALMIAHTLMLVVLMSDYDGTWENDPLDLRSIRLDSEIEQGIWPLEDVWVPQTLSDCYTEEFEHYGLCCKTPPERFQKKIAWTFIIDKDDNIVDRYVHDPYVALEYIRNLAKENNCSMEDYRIWLAKEKKFVSFEEAKEYE